MRTALISISRTDEDGEPIGLLPLAGRPLVSWQVQLVRRLGAEKIICLCDEPYEEIIHLQNQLEREGIQFRTVRGQRQLLGQVSSDDELIVLEDGLLFDGELAQDLFGSSRGVATLDADEGKLAGLERIDAVDAWAGLLVARGSIVERLDGLPDDSDTISALLRLALQAGATRRSLQDGAVSDGKVRLIDDDAQLEDLSRKLLEDSLKRRPPYAPGLMLADIGALALVKLGWGKVTLIAVLVAAVSMIAALGFTWIETRAIALALVALGTFSLALAASYSSLLDRLSGKARAAAPFAARLTSVAVDAVLFVTLVGLRPERIDLQSVFLALAAIISIRLAFAIDRRPIGTLWRDRILLTVLLAISESFGVLPFALMFIVLMALIWSLGRTGGFKLTPV